MKRAAFEKLCDDNLQKRNDSQDWVDELLEHPIPDIQQELLIVYNNLTKNCIKKARCNPDEDIFLETDDKVLVWMSPTSRFIRYGAHADVWPVNDETLWPLSGVRAFAIPQMPKDVWEVICSHCNVETLLNISLLSKKHYHIVCNEHAEWWTRRRKALLEQHPGIELPTKMWLFYMRWDDLANGNVKPTYNDITLYLAFCVPDGVEVNLNQPEPLIYRYEGLCCNRLGNPYRLKQIVGHVFIPKSSMYLTMIQTYAPTRFIVFWGTENCSEKPRNSPLWKYQKKQLFTDQHLTSALLEWSEFISLACP